MAYRFQAKIGDHDSYETWEVWQEPMDTYKTEFNPCGLPDEAERITGILAPACFDKLLDLM